MNHPFAPFMIEAIRLAERGRFATAPNPVVGAVLVRDGAVVARGWHRNFGGPHAEVECLADAAARGVNPADCTLVVTLEPCAHHGKTPPCVEAILRAGIRHVVIGLREENPVAAGGAEALQAAGVQVEWGLLEAACRDLVSDFLVWQRTQRPYVFLKLATTLDGRIATRTGQSRWISGEAARKEVHAFRAGIGLAGGAILVGGNTLFADNPLLTARLMPATRQPLAVVLTSRIANAQSVQLFQDRPHESLIFTSAAGAASPRAAALREQGVRVVGMKPLPGSLAQSRNSADLNFMLEHLRQEEKCPYVFCEGGGKLGLSLLEAGLVDEFHLYLAPIVLGDNEARPLFDGRGPMDLSEALPLRLARMGRAGVDAHLVFRRRD